MNHPTRIPKPRRKLSRHVEEIDDGEGNWLISYADLMTLLWGFFVILSAFSEPNAAKFEKLKQETAEAMGGKYESPYNTITDTLRKIIQELHLEQQVKLEQLTDGLRITAESGTFFDTGSAGLLPNAQDILVRLASVLKDNMADHRILIEGHTDDVPIASMAFPSNWELSLRRASEVVRLFESVGIPHAALRPIGVADVEPLVNPAGLADEELKTARARNRRVVIRLQRTIGQPVTKSASPRVP